MTACAVILAAGRGARLGGAAKALLPAGGGETFLARVVRTSAAAGARDCVVVVGPPYGVEVAAAARALGARVVENARPERGMASSVALGFGAVAAGDGALLWPVDHARVAAATVCVVIAAGTRANIAVPVHAGRGGHPTWFGAAVWPELVACAGEPDGARGVVRRDPARVVRLDVDDAGVIADVDEPGDLP